MYTAYTHKTTTRSIHCNAHNYFKCTRSTLCSIKIINRYNRIISTISKIIIIVKLPLGLESLSSEHAHLSPYIASFKYNTKLKLRRDSEPPILYTIHTCIEMMMNEIMKIIFLLLKILFFRFITVRRVRSSNTWCDTYKCITCGCADSAIKMAAHMTGFISLTYYLEARSKLANIQHLDTF